MFSGGLSGEVTPDSIPNSEVKLSSADGTAHVLCGRVGRRRIFFEEPKGPCEKCGGFFCLKNNIVLVSRGVAVNAPMFDYNQIPPGYYDEIFWRQRGIQSKWHHLKFLGVYKTLQTLGPGKVLDVGCGPGTLAGVLAEYDYTGVDLSPGQIEYANSRYGSSSHRFLVAKAGELDFSANCFDFLTSVEVIEHITPAEAKAMLTSSMRFLKPGGWIVLTTPNYRSHWPILEVLVSKLSPMNYIKQHITHYTAASLRQLLIQLGFVNCAIRSFVHMAPFVAGLNWRLADWLFDFEFKHYRVLGATLLAVAQKPLTPSLTQQ